jgi:hypothetical protein
MATDDEFLRVTLPALDLVHNQLVLRRRMRKVIDGLLRGLRQISERRGAPPA